MLVVASIFSLFAFVYVNAQSNFGIQKPSLQTTFVQTEIVEDEENEREIAVPDVTVLGRLWEIAQKLIDRKN